MATGANNQWDAIIVGGGLAGIHLALAMDRQGLRPLVVDQPDKHSSSRIAAGIINPITGRRFALTWMYPDLQPVFNEVYQYWETTWNKRFFYPLEIFRSVPHNKLVNDLDAKLSDPVYQSFCRRMTEEEIGLAGKIVRFQGPGFVMKGYRLDTEIFLDSAIQYLREKGRYITGTLEGKEEQLGLRSFQFRSHHSPRLIWANGAAIVTHPLFTWVRMNPNKGEVIQVSTPKSTPRETIKQSAFYIPVNRDQWWIGTYDSWDTIDSNPTKKGFDYLSGKAQALLQPVSITDHVAAIRPAVEDRRPVIGSHPQNPQLYLLNGFGSKGSSLIPYFTRQLLAHMLEGQPIHPEADVRRYWGG